MPRVIPDNYSPKLKISPAIFISSMMQYLIGLDIGTSSVKAVAFDLKRMAMVEKQIGYPLLNPSATHFEQDPHVIFNAVTSAIRQVVRRMQERYPDHAIAAVSLSSAMHSLIAVDDGGGLLTNSIIWADNRSKPQADSLKKSPIGHAIYLKTGTPIHPMSPLCKLMWMKENDPAVFHRAYKFISIKEFVCWKLFGHYVVDFSIASATGLFNIFTLDWHGPSLSLLGITPDRLSTPVPITHRLVGIEPTWAHEMGIGPSTPFIIGGSDGCLANVGANAVRPGEAALTIGTSGAIRVISDTPKSDKLERIFSYILTPEIYVLGGPVNNGGVILRWFKENFAAKEVEEAIQGKASVYDLLTAKAAEVPPGADGLLFLPYLLGERSPHWNSEAKGVFFGIQLGHKSAHFVRSIMEGIIFGLYSVAIALEETTGSIKIIHANGGFARSSLWVQILADVFNKKVVISESIESSALGAAIVGMKALGLIEDFSEVLSLPAKEAVFLPNFDNHQIYTERFATFERLYEKLKDEF